MVPENKLLADGIRTEELPAQEKLTLHQEQRFVLTAEQVYAQRFAESQQNGDQQGQGFIP